MVLSDEDRDKYIKQSHEAIEKFSKIENLKDHPGFKEFLADIDSNIKKVKRRILNLTTPEAELHYWRGSFNTLEDFKDWYDKAKTAARDGEKLLKKLT